MRTYSSKEWIWAYETCEWKFWETWFRKWKETVRLSFVAIRVQFPFVLQYSSHLYCSTSPIWYSSSFGRKGLKVGATRKLRLRTAAWRLDTICICLPLHHRLRRGLHGLENCLTSYQREYKAVGKCGMACHQGAAREGRQENLVFLCSTFSVKLSGPCWGNSHRCSLAACLV